MEIYCVKLRQRVIYGRPTSSYFPFERFYIVPDTFLENNYWKMVFPHMLVVESTEKLLGLLDKIPCHRGWEITTRNGQKTITSVQRTKMLKSLPDMNHRKIVVPTYLKSKKLGYLWTIMNKFNVHGLELSLYTPNLVIPSICYRCTNLSSKYAGECTLSDERCRKNIHLDLEEGA